MCHRKTRFRNQLFLKMRQGFKDALIGVYLGMDKPKTGSTYGLYTTLIYPWVCCRQWAYNYDNATVANVGVGGAFYNNVVIYIYLDGECEKGN